jgi:hypothetical protein
MHRPVIAITHAAFSEARRLRLRNLMAQLRLEAPDTPVVVAEDHDRRGSLWCWRQAMAKGLAVAEATHVVWLPDDAIVCKDFGRILRACIQCYPGEVFDCYANATPAELAKLDGAMWYSAPDAYTGMGGCMPRALLEDHLAWRERIGLGDHYTNDGGVNLWAMHTKRRIYKTAFTLVQHDTTTPSLDGNDAHDYREGSRWVDDVRSGVLFDVGNFLGRTYLAPEEHRPGYARSCVKFSRRYQGNHWALVGELSPDHWNVDAMYQAERHGEPVSETPSVLMVVPEYRESLETFRRTHPAREAVIQDLADHGITAEMVMVPGDSLVQRMRQRAMHRFLKSAHTHLLWCDLDIEPTRPSCAREMLRSGFDVVGGACPFRDERKRCVFNPLPGSVGEQLVNGEAPSDTLTLPHGCLEVSDVGTGFQLVSRKAIVRMCEAYPELLHWSRSEGERGEPLWALYDTGIVDGVLQSEDFMFCKRWQALGGKVYVHVPSTFRHWGTYGYNATLAEQLGLEAAS